MIRTIAPILALFGAVPVVGQDSVFQSFLASSDKAAEKGDFAAAEKLLASALREVEGNESKQAMVWVKLGFIADATTRYAEAEKHFKNGVAQAEKTKDRNLIAHRLTLLANHYMLCEKYDLAEPLYKRALAIREKANGPNAWETAQLLRDIGTMHREAGRLEAAESIYRRALSALETSKGREYHLAFCLASLAELKLRQEKLDEAEALCRQALETYDRQKAPVQFNRALCFGTLAESLRRQKKLEAAEQCYAKSLNYLEEAKVTNVRAVPLLKNAANFYAENGRSAESKKLSDRAGEIAAKQEKANAP